MMDSLAGSDLPPLPYVGFGVGDDGETLIIVAGVSLSPAEALMFAQLIYRHASQALNDTWATVGNA